MAHKRLRPEHDVRNYTYHCLIEGEPPQVLWDTARGMQTLWNRLVDLHETMRGAWTKDDPDEATRRQCYKDLLDTHGSVYTACRDEGAALGLSAWQKWHVHDTFQNAMKAWRKHQRDAPRRHHGLRNIVLPHRMQSGGEPLHWLWRDDLDKHTAILPPDVGHAHRRAYTTVSGTRIPLFVLLHRPLPAHAILKRVALVGTYEPSLRYPHHSGWEWKFQVTLELPPPPAPAVTMGRVAGIDLGWRVWNYGLRVAVISDGQSHHWELALPWDMTNRALRRRQALYMEFGAVPDATGAWRQLWQWKTTIDEALEHCKQDLAAVDHVSWPPEAQQLWTGHVKMRASGLRRLRRTLVQAGIALPVLDAWLASYTTQMRRYRGAQLHLIRARNHLYRLVADWLARHFDGVVLEEDLDLREIAEKPTKTRKRRGQEGKTDRLTNAERRERRANKNRHLASLSTLRRYVREALAKHGRVLHEVPAAYTSQWCRECGTVLIEGTDVWRVCPKGHIQDRDCSAADKLVLAFPPAMRSGGAPCPPLDHAQLLPVLCRISATGESLPEDVRRQTDIGYQSADLDDDIPDVVAP